MVKLAKDEGKRVILDIKGSDLINSLPYKPDIIKPNYEEFISTFFKEEDAYDAHWNSRIETKLQEKISEIHNKCGSITILTRGKYGVVFWNGTSLATIAAEEIIPINTTGCGDAFTSGFASSYMKTNDLETSIRNAMEIAKKNALNIKPGVIL